MKKVKALWVTIAAGIFAALMVAAFTWVSVATGAERKELGIGISTQQQTSAKDTYSGSLRAIARDTSAARSRLESITKERDIVTLIQLLEDSGRSPGVEVSIDAVSPGADDGILKSVVVAVSSSGTFQEMVHLVSILESLSAVSVIDQFEMERGNNSSGNWHMQVRVRFLVEGDS